MHCCKETLQRRTRMERWGESGGKRRVMVHGRVRLTDAVVVMEVVVLAVLLGVVEVEGGVEEVVLTLVVDEVCAAVVVVGTSEQFTPQNGSVENLMAERGGERERTIVAGATDLVTVGCVASVAVAGGVVLVQCVQVHPY